MIPSASPPAAHSAIPGALSIEVAGETLALLPDRALFWARESTVMVADTHLGKDASFRAAGIGVPGGGSAADLGRLAEILRLTQARRLVVLGDFLHAASARVERLSQEFTAFRTAHRNVEFTLVRGNHDHHAGDPPSRWRVRCVDAPHFAGPFTLVHDADGLDPGYALAGHVHPGARLASASDSLTLPCFVIGLERALLPAFARFAGATPVAPCAGDRLFPIAAGQVYRLPADG